MPDCGASGCQYSKNRKGMRAVSSCVCDRCPECNMNIKPSSPMTHRPWCKMQAWIPPHHRGKMRTRNNVVINITHRQQLLIMPLPSHHIDK